MSEWLNSGQSLCGYFFENLLWIRLWSCSSKWSSPSVILYLLFEVRYGRSFTLLSYSEVRNYLLVAGISVFVFVYEAFLNCNI